MQPCNEIYIPPAPETTAEARSLGKPYDCDDCDKSFRTSGHLARHLRVHVGDRHHVCPFPGCKTRCSRKDNLTQHYRIHFDLRTPEDLAREAPGIRRRKMRVARAARTTPSYVDGVQTPPPTSPDPTAPTRRRARSSRGHDLPPATPSRPSSPASSSGNSSFSSSSTSASSSETLLDQGYAPLLFAHSLTIDADNSFGPACMPMSSLPSEYLNLQYGRSDAAYGTPSADLPGGYHMPQYSKYPAHLPHTPDIDILTYAPPFSRVCVPSNPSGFPSSFTRWTCS